MATFFTFTPGSEARARAADTDTAPLLGRFRAVPGERHVRKRDSFSARALLGSVRGGLGGIFGESDSDDGMGDGDEERSGWRGVRQGVRDLWLRPQQGAVRRCVGVWWKRWSVLVFLPAGIVSTSFGSRVCAVVLAVVLPLSCDRGSS